MLNLFLENFVLIFIAIDPISLLPIFAAFTQGLNKKTSRLFALEVA